MKKNTRKLLNNRGETISEILVASGIAALALTLLAGMITVAGRMITDSHAAYEEYLDRNNSFIAGEAQPIAGTLSIRGESDTAVRSLLPGDGSVQVYVNAADGSFLYRPAAAGDAQDEDTQATEETP